MAFQAFFPLGNEDFTGIEGGVHCDFMQKSKGHGDSTIGSDLMGF